MAVGSWRQSPMRHHAAPRQSFRFPLTPAFHLKDGTEVYTDIRLLKDDPEARVGVAWRVLRCNYLHWRPDRLGNLALDFTLTVGNTNAQPGWLHGERPTLLRPSCHGTVRREWTTRPLATHCSPHYFNCFTAFVTVDKALKATAGGSVESTVAGVVVGVLIGFLVMALYQRNRGLVRQLRRAIRRERLRGVPARGAAGGPPDCGGGSTGAVDRRRLRREPCDVRPSCRSKRIRGWLGAGDSDGSARYVHESSVASGFQHQHKRYRKGSEDPAFPPRLERLLTASGVAAKALVIEITESSTAKNSVAVEPIRQLRASGHHHRRLWNWLFKYCLSAFAVCRCHQNR